MRVARRQFNIEIAPLEIKGPGGARLEQSNEIIRVDGASLHAANCRFEVDFGNRCLWARNCPQLTLSNCLFTGNAIYAIDWESGERGTAVIENCVLTTRAGLDVHCCKEIRESSIRLAHNSILGCWPFVATLDSLPPPEDPPRRRISVSSSENIFLGTNGILHFTQSERFVAEHFELIPQLAAEALRRLVEWQEERNLYEVRRSEYLSLDTSIKHVKDWEGFWNHKNTHSLQARIRFKSGDLIWPVSRLDACRLQTASIGQASAKDGRDLGANIDLVGPGEAYQRWTKTPEYRNWLNQFAQDRVRP
jgi:hypothetical protein